jgi:hypothetical protein
MHTTPSTSTQAIPNAMSRNNWARIITSAWQSQVSSIFETGSYLKDAQDELKHGEWIAMIKTDLPFGRSTANKLMKIAKCDHLRVADHGPHLPACWRTLYELTALTQQQFKRGIETGAINNKTQRKDVKALRGDKPKDSNSKPSLREQLAQANQEIERLKRNGGDLFSPNDSARDVAQVLVRTLGSNKLERVIKVCRELQTATRKDEEKVLTGVR